VSRENRGIATWIQAFRIQMERRKWYRSHSHQLQESQGIHKYNKILQKFRGSRLPRACDSATHPRSYSSKATKNRRRNGRQSGTRKPTRSPPQDREKPREKPPDHEKPPSGAAGRGARPRKTRSCREPRDQTDPRRRRTPIEPDERRPRGRPETITGRASGEGAH